jgi:hypothetical protein
MSLNVPFLNKNKLQPIRNQITNLNNKKLADINDYNGIRHEYFSIDLTRQHFTHTIGKKEHEPTRNDDVVTPSPPWPPQSINTPRGWVG